MSTMSQFAALSCFEAETRKILDERRLEFKARCEFLLPNLRQLGFEITEPPAGGLYIYANIAKYSSDSRQFCLDMLENHGLAITPGNDFGRFRANEHVRFAFTTGMDDLRLGVERLQEALG